MIPKIIHYTWFSNEPLSPEIQACIDSWKKHMPDYTIVKWDMDKIAGIDNIFMREAIAKRKWAFAADFVRLYAVYHQGGIYLDTDMMMLRPLDPMLEHRAFIGRENSFHLMEHRTEHFLTSHCFGAEPGHPFVKRCLDYYEGRRFVTGTCPDLPVSLTLDMTLMPYIQSEIAKQWGYNPSTLKDVRQDLPDGLTVYPSRYFDPQPAGPDSYGRHLALGSWRESRISRPPVDWRYKIEWRVVAIFRSILARMGYVIIKKN